MSTDYLLGLAENKNPANTELQTLHLRDDGVDAIWDLWETLLLFTVTADRFLLLRLPSIMTQYQS